MLRSRTSADDLRLAAKAGRPASSAMSGMLLRRQLASEGQMAGPGTRIIGAGTGRELRDAPRLAREYGGDPSDWVKMSSGRYRDGGGVYDLFETHWYENARFSTRPPGRFSVYSTRVVAVGTRFGAADDAARRTRPTRDARR